MFFLVNLLTTYSRFLWICKISAEIKPLWICRNLLCTAYNELRKRCRMQSKHGLMLLCWGIEGSIKFTSGHIEMCLCISYDLNEVVMVLEIFMTCVSLQVSRCIYIVICLCICHVMVYSMHALSNIVNIFWEQWCRAYEHVWLRPDQKWALLQWSIVLWNRIASFRIFIHYWAFVVTIHSNFAPHLSLFAL